MFRKANQLEQKWSKTISIIRKSLPVCVYTPVLISSVFNYFTTDLETDAFELTYPMWYVTPEIIYHVHSEGSTPSEKRILNKLL